MRLKGSIIYFALLAALIGGILSIILLQYKDLNTVQLNGLSIRSQLRENINGLEKLYFSGSLDVPLNEEKSFLIHDSERDSVKIEKDKWGLFEKLVLHSFYGDEHYSKTILCGQEIDGLYPSLYVANNETSIKLGGKTRLSGDLKLPNAKLERSYAEQKYYTGSKLHYGTLTSSEKYLPPLKEGLVDFDFNELEEISLEEFFENEEFEVSLSSNGAKVNLSSVEELKEVNVKGAVVLYSNKPLAIDASCKLENVIIQAPQITVKKGAIIQAQLFASESVVIHRKAKLNYPSVIMVNGSSGDKLVHFKEGTSFAGVCLVLGSVGRSSVKLTSEDNMNFVGQMYVAGNAQLKGRFNGSVYAKQLYLKTKSSFYNNHLIDVEIKQELPLGFIGVPLFEEDFSNSVLIYEN